MAAVDRAEIPYPPANQPRDQYSRSDRAQINFNGLLYPTYAMRARDSGTAGYVYWTTTNPLGTPITTTPQYTGTLSATSIQRTYYA